MHMRTFELHRSCPQLFDFDAKVTSIEGGDGDTMILELDRTAFYARSGGQEGDQGVLVAGDRELIVRATRYSPGRDAVWHYIESVPELGPLQDVRVEGHVDRERRDALTVGHTAQHLAYLASVVVLGPRDATGGLIDVDTVRVDIAHTGDEGHLDPSAIAEAYQELVTMDLPISRWVDADRPDRWWWAIEGHPPIGCGGTHLDRTGLASLLEPTVKRKGSKNAVIKLVRRSA